MNLFWELFSVFNKPAKFGPIWFSQIWTRPGEAGPDLKNYLFYVFNACFVLLDLRPIFSKPRPGLNLAKTVGPKSAEAELAD